MANILGVITDNTALILEVDADPAAGIGTPAPKGSLAMYGGAGQGNAFVKTDVSDLSWKPILTTVQFDPTLNQFIYDDFMCGAVAGGKLSTLAWDVVTSGGALVDTDATVVAPDHPGVVQFQVSSNGQSANLGLGGNGYFFGTTDVEFKASINIDTLATITQDYVFRIGFGDTTNGTDYLDGVYFEYNRSASLNWRGRTANNGARTSVIGSVVVATGWARLRFLYRGSAGAVDFYVNDIFIGTISTNIPQTVTRVTDGCMTLVKTLGNTNRIVYVDYYWLRMAFPTAR